MFRKAVFASLIALGAASAGVAQAADEGPFLVNRTGSPEVVYDSPRGTVVGGAHAPVAGGGDPPTARAAPGARVEEPRLIGRLTGGGNNEQVTYTAPAEAPAAQAGWLGGARG